MTKHWRTVVAVATIATAVAVASSLLRKDPINRMVEAAPRDGRRVEARLSGGFPWAPVASRTRAGGETLDRAGARLSSIAWSVLAATRDDDSPRARHAAAIALALENQTREAMTRLAELAAGSGDANVWSDLAAARYGVASAEEDASMLAEALVAADAALRLAPSLPEALFNRALILERLGLRDHAREAWERYASVESDAAWAAEARNRARQLPPVESFGKELKAEAELLARDAKAARALARSDPHNARRWGETKVLGDWAEAERKGDRVAAEKSLRIARAFAAELAETTGEGMLAGAVAAIDRADPQARQHLVEAHLLFRDGQSLSMDDRAAEAQRALIRASQAFTAGGSPLALVSDYFIGHTYHTLGNLPEARERELLLLRTAPPQYPAHRAQLLWHIGLGYQSDGEWGKAMPVLNESVAIFERLGEAQFAAKVRNLIAEVYDRIGDPPSAWSQRVRVLRQLGRVRTGDLQLALDSVSRGAILAKQWPVAVSFLNLANDVAEHVGRPLIQVELRLMQARAYAQTRQFTAAASAIAQARTAAAKLEDATSRDEALADAMATEAIIAASPHDAVALLTTAIEHHRTRGRLIRLPDMFLRRGRAYRAIGNDSAAAVDFEAGITAVEKHRESLARGADRWGIYHAADELLEEALQLALARRDAGQAFAYSERARARELLDALRTSAPAAIPASMATEVAVVEYAVLPERLVIFVMTRGVVRVAELRVNRLTLEREADAFISAVRDSADAAAERGNVLYRRLIEPIASWIASTPTLVIVAPPSLAAVPFTALPTGRGFLLQQHTLIHAPSAAVFEHLSSVRRPAAPPRHLFAIANPSTEGDRERLPASEREIAAAARLYPSATPLTGDRATPAAFRRNAPDADVVHLATHGVLPARTGSTAALLLAGGNLDVPAIAATPMPSTEVVVLAACSSARGTPRAEGTISVARAFLAAGVPTVVATLWPIGDTAAAGFFPRLHQHLARGAPAAVALRATQLESIRRGEPPALWAAMQAIGR